jgi:hypothetical protein
MTPLGVPIETSSFFHPYLSKDGAAPEHHNVDKNMLAQDLTLITTESKSRSHQKNFVALYKLHSEAALQTQSVHKGKGVKLVGERAFEDAFVYGCAYFASQERHFTGR